MKTTFIISAILIVLVGIPTKETLPVKEAFPKANVNYNSFEKLVKTVKTHRQKRLINLNEFSEKSKKDNVIILDTRSKKMFDRKHIKGAIHLNFADFTQRNLARIIPDTKTTILIYCNNNFNDDQINFASKIALPKSFKDKKLTLALNIPTYINLYGYGYKNVYELNELISVLDQRIEFEGTEAKYLNQLKIKSTDENTN